jgi:signal recognition particle subunit SRP19
MDYKDFIVIYPSYIDSTKTIQQGRRIAKEACVDTPTVSDISLVLQELGIRHITEPYKGYSRDQTTLWDNPGRVRYEPPKFLDLSDKENSTPSSSRQQVLIEVASKVPHLEQRKKRLQEEAKAKEAELLQREKQQAERQKLVKQQHHQPASSQPSSTKKKGKKKR